MNPMSLAGVVMAVSLAFGAFGCSPGAGDGGGGEGAREARVSEVTGDVSVTRVDDAAAVEEASGLDVGAESPTACLPPKVLCPCYNDGIERCVGAGLCSKCCRGLIGACDLNQL